MPQIPRKRITLHIAINEKGDHCLSECGSQQALEELVRSKGGDAYRVVDLDVDVLFASPEETRHRRLETAPLRIVK